MPERSLFEHELGVNRFLRGDRQKTVQIPSLSRLQAGPAYANQGDRMQNSSLRRVLLSTTGVALALGASEARAQDVLETVIVTAEKQATDIQKTGLSITAIQPDNVSTAGQARLTDIMQNVPGVVVYRGAVNNGGYFIRGVGTIQGTNSTLELVDGVYVSWYIPEAISSADASRIEVLRGPQGTLYGRGAFGGVINVITNDPSDKYEGKIFV